MMWLYQYWRVWRVAALALLVVALLGPWWFDRIYVPSEYACSAPVVRLEGNFCGLAMPITYILFGLGAQSLDFAFKWLSGAASPLDPAYSFRGALSYSLFGLLGLALVLPFVTTLLLTWRGERRFWQVLHIVIWSLAALEALLLSVTIARLEWAVVLWGNWLYVGVAAAALIAEAAMLMGRRDSHGRAVSSDVGAEP